MAEETKSEGAKITVDDDLCIGCGTCISIAPECFKFNDQGKSTPISGCKDMEKAQKAADECPVAAIEIK